MSRISVSVVIPCYNAEAYVRDAVLSALNQTYPIEQIICVDDGSTDNTLSILQELCREYPHRLTVRTGPNRGGNHARNIGLGLSASEYVQFLDADDILLKNKIEHQVALISSKDVKPDLIAASFKVKNLDGNEYEQKVGVSDHWIDLIRKELGITSSNLWRRCFLHRIGGWDSEMPSSQEADLMFRMLKKGANVAYDNTCLTLIRKQEGSIGTSEKGVWRPENKKRYFKLRGEIILYLHDNNLLTEKRMKIGIHSIFENLRLLQIYEPEIAYNIHEKVIPKSFVPKYGFNSYLYICFYSLLGFKWAQVIKNLFK